MTKAGQSSRKTLRGSMTDSAKAFLNAGDAPRLALEDDLKAMIRDGSDDMPRNQQVALGPSEVGTPCLRQLAYGLLHEEECNPDWDPLAALRGTAFHEWMKWAADRANERLGRVRWLAEKKVGPPGPGRRGTCDLYDLDTHSVIDHKCPGPTRFKHYTTHGPSLQYETQTLIYGYGWEELGLPVEHVGIYWINLVSTVDKTKLWWRPYDRALAEKAFARVDSTIAMCDELRVDEHPERYELIPTTPTDDCRFCNWWTPNPQGPYQCGGQGILPPPD